MKRACGYVHIEDMSQVQVGGGLRAQRKSIAAYCQKHHMQLVGFEEDMGTGLSDALSDRAGWWRVITAVAQRQIQAVVVAGLQHLDAGLLVQECQLTHVLALGAEMHSVAEPQLGDDDSGRMQFRNVRNALGLYERAAEVAGQHAMPPQAGHRRGRQALRAPYGYRVGRFAGNVYVMVCEAQAKVVRCIYESFMRGQTARGIAHILTNNGVRPRRGSRWTEAMILSVLTDPYYTGESERHGVRGRLGHEHIIDSGLFAAVQAQLEEQRLRRAAVRLEPHDR